VTKVDVEIKPGSSKRIDCRKRDQWINVTIYSNGAFDATSVDPGSVVVSGGSGDLGFSGEQAIQLISSHTRSKQMPAQSNRSAYQWRWHLDDVDGDGSTDMVLEFRLDYTELTCDAAVVAVSGRTQNGKRFEGTKRVDMLVLDQS
jgi:hypothetical protein